MPKKLYKYSTNFYRKRAKILKNQDRVGRCNEVIPQIIESPPEPTLESTDKIHTDTHIPSTSSISATVTDTTFSEPIFNFNEDIEGNYFLEMMNEFEDAVEEPDDSKLKLDVKELLHEWAIKNSIRHSALNELLSILISAGIQNLPRDSRTLLHTPATVVIQSMGTDGQFWYNGVESCLKINHIILDNDDNIENLRLNFHIDGVPISASSKKQFWPILMDIANIPEIKPMVVAIYCGDSKPNSAEIFLRQFVDELNPLLKAGIYMGSKKLSLIINAILCDTPARCFVKCIKSYNAYNSCSKCHVIGQYYKEGRHISFPETTCPPRTDFEFRNKLDPEHHQIEKNGDNFLISPLENLPIDLIKDIPVADSLHLIDLGIVKRCLRGWVHGSYNFRTKFFQPQINSISEWLRNSNLTMPSEIHRSVRGLDSIAFWKATEFRTFLLYLGPVILKNNLNSESYKHFMLLFCAITILSSNFYVSKSNFLSLAEQLLNDYIEMFISIYGIDSISSNVHCLCHVVDDVKRLGALPNISTYKFENHLGILKNYLRKGHQPLAQVAKRLTEKSFINNYCSNNLNNQKISYFIKGIKFKEDKKNRWFLTNKNKVICIQKLIYQQSKTQIEGRSLTKLKNFFEYPFESKNLSIYISSEVFDELTLFYTEEDIKCKLVCLNYQEKLVFFPLLHTFDLFNK